MLNYMVFLNGCAVAGRGGAPMQWAIAPLQPVML